MTARPSPGPRDRQMGTAKQGRKAHLCDRRCGSVAGGRGVGRKTIASMEDEHRAPALDLMQRVKAAFDPMNLFNPGKVFAV